MMKSTIVKDIMTTADLGHRVVDKIRRVQGVVAVHDNLAYPPAEASFAGLRF